MSTERRQLIYKAAETLPNGFEFDARMIQEILFEQFDEVLSAISIGKHLKTMNFCQRELEKGTADYQRWRVQYGTEPSVVYSKHNGKEVNNYSRGYAKPRPLISELQEIQKDTEECAVCPEFDTCQGEIRPCPRYPVQVGATKHRVMRLEDFE